MNGPQVEIRRYYPGLPTTGMLYGEALGTNWFSSQKKIEEGHKFFMDESWNKLRIVAKGPANSSLGERSPDRRLYQ